MLNILLINMRKIIVIFFVMFSLAALSAQYSRVDSIKVVNLLAESRTKSFASSSDCALFFGRKLSGVPYVASTLEVNKTERLIVNLRQLDCTTFVENVVALTFCWKSKTFSFDAFCSALRRIRYKGGEKVDYTTRLHYFTGWIEDNSRLGLCYEVQSPDPPFTNVQRVNVNYMTAHSDKYPMLVRNAANQRGIYAIEKELSGRTYRYIPKSQIKNTKLLRSAIHNGDIIAIITNKKGLDTQHIGFAVWHNDGLHLLNASSIHRKVVEEPRLLSEYLAKKKTMTGIRIVRLK